MVVNEVKVAQMPVLMLLFIILSVVGCGYLETKEVYYINYESLADDDEPGNWIPEFIPKTFVNMRSIYKIDTGAQLLSFSFTDPNDMQLGGYCEGVSGQGVEFPPQNFLRAKWWPVGLTSKTGESPSGDYSFYRCRRNAYLAVNVGDGRSVAFYWRISLSSVVN